MLNTSQSLASLASLSRDLSLDSGFDGLGFAFPGKESEGALAGLGVSTAAAPLISAPVARQSVEFQAAIAPPTRPTNPSIAPPTTGSDANAIKLTGVTPGNQMEKMAYGAEVTVQRAGSLGNTPSGDWNKALVLMAQRATG